MDSTMLPVRPALALFLFVCAAHAKAPKGITFTTKCGSDIPTCTQEQACYLNYCAVNSKSKHLKCNKNPAAARDACNAEEEETKKKKAKIEFPCCTLSNEILLSNSESSPDAGMTGSSPSTSDGLYWEGMQDDQVLCRMKGGKVAYFENGTAFCNSAVKCSGVGTKENPCKNWAQQHDDTCCGPNALAPGQPAGMKRCCDCTTKTCKMIQEPCAICPTNCKRSSFDDQGNGGSRRRLLSLMRAAPWYCWWC